MGFFNYQTARELYFNSPFMLDIVNRLKEMDCYHLLRDSDIPAGLECKASSINEDYKKWLSVCDGGLLFSTTLLSISAYDEELDLSFSTLQEFNSQEKRKHYKLPDGYTVIALLNYGDPICVSESDSKIHLWDTQEYEFTTIWNSFADFLADEYNTAIQMIEDNALEPVPMKHTEEQDG